MRRPLAAVNLVQVLEREAELACELFGAGVEIAFRQGGEFVEDWLDWVVSAGIMAIPSLCCFMEGGCNPIGPNGSKAYEESWGLGTY